MRGGTKTKGFHSLAYTMATAFLLLSLGTLLITSLFVAVFNLRTQQKLVANQQISVAQEAASTVKSFISEKQAELVVAARLGQVADNSASMGREHLDKLLGLQPAFRQLILFDGEQKMLGEASRISSLSPDRLGDTKYLSKLFAKTKQGGNYISPVYINQTTSEPMTIVGVPITNALDNFRGVLAAEVNLKFMWDLVGKIKIGDSGQAYVVDNRGRLIAFGDTSRVLRGENLSHLSEVHDFISNPNQADKELETGKGINGTQVVSIYVPLGTPSWAVVAELPTSEAYRAVVSNLIKTVAVVAASVGLAAGASIYLSRKITRPIIYLRDAAREIGKGNLDTHINVKSRNELGELALSFNAMAEGLQSSGQKLHEEHARLQASIEGLSAGFLLVDIGGKIITQNKALKTILGLTQPAETLQQLNGSLSKLDLAATAQKVQTSQQTIEAKEVSAGTKILHIFASPVSVAENDKDTVIGTVILVEDITEQKVLDRSKDEFFSIASHELRTPLTSIKGNASMIMQFYADALKDKDLKEMIEDIHTSSVRLIDIVNDFLDASRLEQGKMAFNYAEFSIEEIVEGVVYEMRTIIGEKKLYLKFDKMVLNSLPKVWADKNRTKQIVYNLVGNAAKFTEQGGISIGAQAEKDFVKVSVADTGRGVPLDSQKLLFHKFQQTGSSLLTRDTTRGTGLGLYISKVMIENMGGQIALEHSEEGKGTTFSFTLPVSTELARQTRPTESAAMAGKTDSTTGLSTGPQ